MDIDDILKDFEDSAREEKLNRQSGTNLYQELLRAMINERMSPELLPYKHELMTSVLRSISDQQQYLLESHEYGDINSGSGVLSSDFKLQLMIIETELERLNYIIRLYMRTRLSKLNKFTIFYVRELNEDDELLSREEKDYIHKYLHISTQLYNNCFLKKLPPSATLLDDTTGEISMIVTPDVDQPVFIKCVSERPIILDYDGTTELDLELVKDGVYVVKYSLIKRYLEIGDVIMI
ncbi:SLD5 DNA replication complex GINS protein SLD5 [Candida maltosa Xu316]